MRIESVSGSGYSSKYILNYSFLFASIFLFIFLCSCLNQKKDLILSLSDSISFQLDTNNTTATLALFYHEENGRKYLTFSNKDEGLLNVYDFDSHRKVFQIHVPLLPFQKWLGGGFYIKNFDSIYVPVDGFKIFQIDKSGHLIKTIDYYDLTNKYPFLNQIYSQSRFTNEAVNIGNDIFFYQPDSKLNYQKNSAPSYYHFCIRYNIPSDQMSLMGVSLPDDFLKSGLKQYTLSMAYDGNRFIYAPLYSHDLYTSIDNSAINEHFYVKSRYVNNLNEYYPSEEYVPSMEEFAYIYNTSQFYIGILWDKYRHVYYRFFWPGIDSAEAKNTERSEQVFFHPPNYGIMVLDENFNTIDEMLLPMNIYTWDKYFVAEEGLYLSADYQVHRPGIKTLTFHIYKLEHKSK